jgi:hypothetical protein
MITPKPTVQKILDDYYYHGTCTITLLDRTKINGDFTVGQIKEHGKIIGWYFIPHKEKPIINVYHNQIAVIERPD